MTEIKRELFDIKLDAKKCLYKAKWSVTNMRGGHVTFTPVGDVTLSGVISEVDTGQIPS